MVVRHPAMTAKRVLLRRAGRVYLAGPTLPNAVAVARLLREQGLNVTLSYWAAVDQSPQSVAAEYGTTIAAAATLPGTDVAIKVPDLGYNVDLVGSVARASAKSNVRVWFDSHWIDSADETLAFATVARNSGTSVGVALPTRWLRTFDDLTMLDPNIDVRLVKGQWADPQSQDFDPRERYCAVADWTAKYVRLVALATHDVHALRRALPRLISLGTPVEVQLLWGLPLQGALKVALALDVPARIYVPFGFPYLMYSAHSVWENRRIALWLAKDILIGGRSQHRRLARISSTMAKRHS